MDGNLCSKYIATFTRVC